MSDPFFIGGLVKKAEGQRLSGGIGPKRFEDMALGNVKPMLPSSLPQDFFPFRGSYKRVEDPSKTYALPHPEGGSSTVKFPRITMGKPTNFPANLLDVPAYKYEPVPKVTNPWGFRPNFYENVDTKYHSQEEKEKYLGPNWRKHPAADFGFITPKSVMESGRPPEEFKRDTGMPLGQFTAMSPAAMPQYGAIFMRRPYDWTDENMPAEWDSRPRNSDVSDRRERSLAGSAPFVGAHEAGHLMSIGLTENPKVGMDYSFSGAWDAPFQLHLPFSYPEQSGLLSELPTTVYEGTWDANDGIYRPHFSDGEPYRTWGLHDSSYISSLYGANGDIHFNKSPYEDSKEDRVVHPSLIDAKTLEALPDNTHDVFYGNSVSAPLDMYWSMENPYDLEPDFSNPNMHVFDYNGDVVGEPGDDGLRYAPLSPAGVYYDVTGRLRPSPSYAFHPAQVFGRSNKIDDLPPPIARNVRTFKDLPKMWQQAKENPEYYAALQQRIRDEMLPLTLQAYKEYEDLVEDQVNRTIGGNTTPYGEEFDTANPDVHSWDKSYEEYERYLKNIHDPVIRNFLTVPDFINPRFADAYKEWIDKQKERLDTWKKTRKLGPAPTPPSQSIPELDLSNQLDIPDGLPDVQLIYGTTPFMTVPSDARTIEDMEDQLRYIQYIKRLHQFRKQLDRMSSGDPSMQAG